MPDWLARVVRTALQVGAAGGFTAIITEYSKIANPMYSGMILAGSVIVITFSQNLIEDKTGKALLKPSGAQGDTVK